jgi:hypothetical protein
MTSGFYGRARRQGDKDAGYPYSGRMFRLTRSEQLLVAGLSLALLVGAVVKHARDTFLRQHVAESK